MGNAFKFDSWLEPKGEMELQKKSQLIFSKLELPIQEKLATAGFARHEGNEIILNDSYEAYIVLKGVLRSIFKGINLDAGDSSLSSLFVLINDEEAKTLDRVLSGEGYRDFSLEKIFSEVDTIKETILLLKAAVLPHQLMTHLEEIGYVEYEEGSGLVFKKQFLASMVPVLYDQFYKIMEARGIDISLRNIIHVSNLPNKIGDQVVDRDMIDDIVNLRLEDEELKQLFDLVGDFHFQDMASIYNLTINQPKTVDEKISHVYREPVIRIVRKALDKSEFTIQDLEQKKQEVIEAILDKAYGETDQEILGFNKDDVESYIRILLDDVSIFKNQEVVDEKEVKRSERFNEITYELQVALGKVKTIEKPKRLKYNFDLLIKVYDFLLNSNSIDKNDIKRSSSIFFLLENSELGVRDIDGLKAHLQKVYASAFRNYEESLRKAS